VREVCRSFRDYTPLSVVISPLSMPLLRGENGLSACLGSATSLTVSARVPSADLTWALRQCKAVRTVVIDSSPDPRRPSFHPDRHLRIEYNGRSLVYEARPDPRGGLRRRPPAVQVDRCILRSLPPKLSERVLAELPPSVTSLSLRGGVKIETSKPPLDGLFAGLETLDTRLNGRRSHFWRSVAAPGWTYASSLRQVDVVHLDDACVSLLKARLPGLERLSAQQYSLSASGMQGLLGMTALRALHLPEESPFSQRHAFEAIPESLDDLELDLRGRFPALPGLANSHPGMRRLCLTLGAEEFAPVESLPPRLQSLLIVFATSPDRDMLLPALRSLEAGHLVELRICTTRFPIEVQLGLLAELCPCIHTLELGVRPHPDNPDRACDLRDPGALAQMPQLRHLYLYSCVLHDSCPGTLAVHPALGALVHLRSCSQLETLYVRSCFSRLGEAARVLISRVPPLPALRYLSLKHAAWLWYRQRGGTRAFRMTGSGFPALECIVYEGTVDLDHLQGLEGRLKALFCSVVRSPCKLWRFRALKDLGLVWADDLPEYLRDPLREFLEKNGALPKWGYR
jgi:hypothetical protein